MTLASTPPLIDYVEDGVTLVHAIPFQFQLGSEIACTRIDADGTPTPLVNGSDFTVTGGAGLTGTLTKTDAGIAGTVFRIQRVTQETQSTSFTTGEAFPAENVELALDREMAIAQETATGLTLLRREAITGVTGDNIPPLAPAPSRASKFMQWAADGKSLLLLGASDLAAAVVAPLTSLLPQSFKGDPGGNAMAIGLFAFASALAIPLGTDLVQTSGYSVKGKGPALYAEDATLNDAYVAANPRTSFKSANARYFKIVNWVINPFHLGALGDRLTDDAPAWQAFSDYLFNNGTVFHDHMVDISGAYAWNGTVNWGPSAASAGVHRWAAMGHAEIIQQQVGGWETVHARNINYGAHALNLTLIASGSADGSAPASFAAKGTAIGITYENCAYSNWGTVFARGHWLAGVSIVCNSPNFAEGLRINYLIAQFNGSGGTTLSLTGNYTAGAQSGAAGSVGQTQQVAVDTLPDVRLDTYGPAGSFPGAVRIRPAGSNYEYLVTGITRNGDGTGTLTVYPWLDPALAANGAFTWCFGGGIYVHGGDTENLTIDNFYAIQNGAAGVFSGAYGPMLRTFDFENNGTALVMGSNPNNVCYGWSSTKSYWESNVNDLCIIGHWGGFQYGEIGGSYTLTTSKIFQIGDPRNSDGSFGFAGGGLGVYGGSPTELSIFGTRHRFYAPNNLIAGASTATFFDHGDRPTVRHQHVNSQTITLGDVDVKLHEFFGYSGGVWLFTGTGPNGSPTGPFPINPKTRAFASCVTTNGSAVVTMPSTAGLVAGMPAAGTGVPGGTTVLSVDSATQIHLSANATASGTVTLTFTGSINGAFAGVTFNGPFTGPVMIAWKFTDMYHLQWQVRLVSGGTAAPRIQTVGSAATVTPTDTNDQVNITAQGGALTLANPTGSPVAGQELVVRIKDNGVARAIAYGTQYRAFGTALPATTTLGKTTYLRARYNATDTKWDVLNAVTEV